MQWACTWPVIFTGQVCSAAVWNRTHEKAAALAGELGCQAPETLAALAGSVDAVVICVSADDDVLEVVSALAPQLRSGALVIDCSTVGSETARKAAELIAPPLGRFPRLPRERRHRGARDATWRSWSGGSDEAFERARPLLAAMGKTVTHFGPTGSRPGGQGDEPDHVRGIIEAVSEAMAFARAQGLPLEKLIDTLGKGAGSSWYFVHRAPNMVRGSYPAGFRVRLHAKDLTICRDMAARFGVALPVVERMLGEYAELVARGYGDEDISATSV